MFPLGAAHEAVPSGGFSLDLPGPLDYVVAGDNRFVLPALPDETFRLVYVDPPFNTGTVRRLTTVRTVRDKTDGTRRTERLGTMSYDDRHDDWIGSLRVAAIEARRVLTDDGTLYMHLGARRAAYAQVMLDGVFGAQNLLSVVCWSWDWGGRPRDRWAAKHDTILVYAKNVGQHFFNQDQIARVPYLTQGLVGPEKQARGKLPTDVWWHTIVPTNGRERTGYPDQKPEGVLRRVVTVSSAPGDRVLDFFAGSGTTGAVCRQEGRRFVMVDRNPEAVGVMRRRLGEDRMVYVVADSSGGGLL